MKEGLKKQKSNSEVSRNVKGIYCGAIKSEIAASTRRDSHS